MVWAHFTFLMEKESFILVFLVNRFFFWFRFSLILICSYRFYSCKNKCLDDITKLLSFNFKWLQNVLEIFKESEKSSIRSLILKVKEINFIGEKKNQHKNEETTAKNTSILNWILIYCIMKVRIELNRRLMKIIPILYPSFWRVQIVLLSRP